MDPRSKMVRCSLFHSLLVSCLVTASSALTVLLEAPTQITPTATTFISAVAAPASVDDDSAAAAASPAGSFDSFGGFAGPKALSNLEGLADFGDLDGQFDSSGFEQAFATPNRRSDSGSFGDFGSSSVAPATYPVASRNYQHYNPQTASGYIAALAAAPTYTAPSSAPVLPVGGGFSTAYRPAAAAAPAYRAPVSAAAPLPLHRPGYVVPLYPPSSTAPYTSGSAVYAPRAVAAVAPGAYSPRPAAAAPYRPSAAAIPAAVRYSALHASGHRPGLSGGVSAGLGSSRAASQQASPTRQKPFDFGGFGFGSELSDNRGSTGGFDFGSEEF